MLEFRVVYIESIDWLYQYVSIYSKLFLNRILKYTILVRHKWMDYEKYFRKPQIIKTVVVCNLNSHKQLYHVYYQTYILAIWIFSDFVILVLQATKRGTKLARAQNYDNKRYHYYTIRNFHYVYEIHLYNTATFPRIG